MVHDQKRLSVAPERVGVAFDDERAVANAGVLLPAVLAGRLGLRELVDQTVRLGGRAGGASPGYKVMSLVSAMALGADSIDDCDILRAGETAALVGHGVAAPSTLGTFLRAFTFGHVRQLDRVLDVSLQRAWRAGAGPGAGRLVVDVDSFIGEVHGYGKQGASFGYTKKRGYHPILASRQDTGEVLHIRLRKGKANTQRGALRFTNELIARVERAGATGQKLFRADSGFQNEQVFARLDRAGWQFSVGMRTTAPLRRLIEEIPEQSWQSLTDYPEGGEAQIAETSYGGRRLIVRRVRTLGAQEQLFSTWQHFPIATNRSEPIEVVEAEHRQHAVVELVIRDLKTRRWSTSPPAGSWPTPPGR